MKWMHLHVQRLALLAHQGTAVSETKATLHVRSQWQAFCRGSHLNHDTEFLSLRDKQSTKFQIKVYGMTQTPQTNPVLAGVLWIIAAQCNGPEALSHLNAHPHSWTSPLLAELSQQRTAYKKNSLIGNCWKVEMLKKESKDYSLQ